MADKRKPYQMVVNGQKTTVLLDADDAEKYKNVIKDAPSKAEARAKAADVLGDDPKANKAVTPATK